MQREDKGACHNLLNELCDTDIPGLTTFMRMTPEFFEMIKAIVRPHVAKQTTNYIAPLSVWIKLAITLRYMVTGESYTSSCYQFMVGRSSISKFLPKFCRAIQEEFIMDYLRCPTSPDD